MKRGEDAATPDIQPVRRSGSTNSTYDNLPHTSPRESAVLSTAPPLELRHGEVDAPAPIVKAQPVQNLEDRPTAAREITLQLKDDDGVRKADVIVLERAGKVHVTVRTADAELTESLRGQLTELVTALDREGYRIETWTPAETVPPGTELSPRGDNNDNDQGGSDADSAARHAFEQQRQQQRRAPRFDWMELFEARLRKEM